MVVCCSSSEGYLGEFEVCLRCCELEYREVGLKVKANLPFQTRGIIRWRTIDSSLIGREYKEHVSIAMSWCALGKVVDGVGEEGKLVE